MSIWNIGIFIQGCFIAIISAQLTVLTGPEALVSSSGSVVEGSVIQIYCTVEDDTAVTCTWTLNGNSLLNDPPHIRIKEDNLPERSVSLLTDDSTSLLTVDNFRESDNGVYQCTAISGATSGNGTAVTLTAVPSTADGTLMLTDQPSFNEPVDLSTSLNDNRTGIALGGTVDGSLLTCTAGHQGDGVMDYPTPSVVWVRSGQVVDDTDSRITITSTTMVNGQVTSSLTVTNFGLPDAGVYQCVFTDGSDGGEVITSIPYQLDAGSTIRIERVSPEIVILRPPQKLVIEVRVSGEYEVLFWRKGTISGFIPGQMRPQEFPNYFETFVRDNTTVEDEGIYIVQPQLKPGTSQFYFITPTGGVDFGVIAPVDAITTSLSTSIVVIPEGGSADISCRSVGAPVPTITWEFNNQTTDFEQTDTETPFTAALTGNIGNRGTDVTPGNIESSLHIVSATYPDHDGVYTCIGTNSDDSSSAFITVQVNVIPEVEINTTDTLVGIENDVTITCFVLRGNPSNYMYTITNTDTGNTTTGPTRILTDIQMTDVGTYRCDVTNDAGTGTSNTVKIELGDPPVVTTIQPDPVMLNTTVELVCVVTGDTPIEIVWERFDVASTVEVVYTGNDITGGNFSLIAIVDNYGMYRCNATSRFGIEFSSVDIVQAVDPTFLFDDADIEVVAGSTLTLTVNITDFNLPLTEITWFIDSVPATAVTGRTGVLTITNTSTTSPPATTTLTLDPVQLPSESGLYSVTVFNPAGMETITFNVIITARPDSPVNVSTHDVGARWVVLSWILSFAGNRPVTNFSLYIRSVDVSESFTQISTLNPSDLMSSAGELMYNVSMQGVILPYTNYSFTVDACNDIGCSNRSDPSPVVKTLQEARLLVQLRLMGVDRCPQWVVENGREKLKTLSEAISTSVQERCQCEFSVVNIMNPKFRCFAESESAVTYRAQISGTVTVSAKDIATYISDWLSEGPLITFDFILIAVDTSCQVVVSSFADPECSAAAMEFPAGAAVGGAIGAVFLLIVVSIFLFVTFCVYRKRTNLHKSKSRSGIEMSAVQANVDAEEGEYEILDTFQAEDELPAPAATPPHTPEYDYVCAGKPSVVSDTKPKDFEFTECAAYSVTGRH